MSNQSARSLNFTGAEKEKIVEIGMEYYDLLHSPLNNSVTMAEKNRIYQLMAEEVNKVGLNSRSVKQIKKKYQELIQNATRKQRIITTERKRTGNKRMRVSLDHLDEEIIRKVPPMKYIGISGGVDSSAEGTHYCNVWDEVQQGDTPDEEVQPTDTPDEEEASGGDGNESSGSEDSFHSESTMTAPFVASPTPATVPSGDSFPTRIVNLSIPGRANSRMWPTEVASGSVRPRMESATNLQGPRPPRPRIIVQQIRPGTPQATAASGGVGPRMVVRMASRQGTSLEGPRPAGPTAATASTSSGRVSGRNVAGTRSLPASRPLSNIPRNMRRRERTARRKEERVTAKLIAEQQEELNRLTGLILEDQKAFHTKKLENEERKLKLREREVEIAEKRLRLEEARERRATANQLLRQQQLAELRRLNETVDLTIQTFFGPSL
nr:PREDICTED: uncharacterized protein LOC109043778 [Bemisia tabaci]XP_018916637.1 PREDICTED: uncharacterized protein LOC109043780 [Bemisia tabaci]